MRLGEGEPLTTTMMGEQLVPLFLALRPKQWLKNSLVVAAPLAGGIAFRWHSAFTIALLFMLLCMVSSAGYLLNDVHDRDYDRAHPIKRHRAIASGAASVPQAVGLATALIALAVLAAFSWTDSATTLLLVCYVVTTITYSLYLKTIPGVEMVVVSAGFLLRAIIGGVGTGTELSGWFLVVICAAALLVVAGVNGIGDRQHVRRLAALDQPLDVHVDAAMLVTVKVVCRHHVGNLVESLVVEQQSAQNRLLCLYRVRRHPQIEKLGILRGLGGGLYHRSVLPEVNVILPPSLPVNVDIWGMPVVQ